MQACTLSKDCTLLADDCLRPVSALQELGNLQKSHKKALVELRGPVLSGELGRLHLSVANLLRYFNVPPVETSSQGMTSKHYCEGKPLIKHANKKKYVVKLENLLEHCVVLVKGTFLRPLIIHVDLRDAQSGDLVFVELTIQKADIVG